MATTELLQPRVVLITGTMAAGKSTVAQALAERFPRSVHLRGDLFRRMIVSGRAEMTAQLSDEAERQLDLRYRLAAMSAQLYVEAGFTVIYQDIIIGRALADIADRFRTLPLSVVVLCPRPDVVAAREAGRSKTGYPNREAINIFDRIVRNETPKIGYWLDSSDLSIAETVEHILRYLPGAQAPA